MAQVRVEINSAGIGQLAKSAQVRAHLEGRAQRMAAAARAAGIRVEGTEGGGDVPLPVEVETDTSPSRARARVVIDHPSGLAVEAKHRVLGRALDAGRG